MNGRIQTIVPRRRVEEGGAKPGQPVVICAETLKSYFHLPLYKAADELGLCVTALKTVCRKVGIRGWPFRKLKIVENRLEASKHDQNMLMRQRQDLLRGGGSGMKCHDEEKTVQKKRSKPGTVDYAIWRMMRSKKGKERFGEDMVDGAEIWRTALMEATGGQVSSEPYLFRESCSSEILRLRNVVDVLQAEKHELMKTVAFYQVMCNGQRFGGSLLSLLCVQEILFEESQRSRMLEETVAELRKATGEASSLLQSSPLF